MILHNATVDTILERRSVRSYAPQQITQDELETILEAGRFAPSGMNQQVSNCCGNAIADACTGSNPRIPSQEEMEQLLKACYYDLAVKF